MTEKWYQFHLWLTKEQRDWLEKEAQKQRRAKVEVVRELIEQARTGKHTS